MKTFSIILVFLEMFSRIVYEITDMLPSKKTCAGAKGFKTLITSLVNTGLDKLDSTSCKFGKKYDR